MLLLSACAATGHYQRSGPCEGWHTDKSGCIRAYDNSLGIGKVELGQSIATVRAVMGRSPERRDASGNVERWSYLTDYDNELMTTITFTNGVVTGIGQTPAGG
jgi:hypothetical protein